jgi:hypothetical protein
LRPIISIYTAHAHAALSTPTASCVERAESPDRPFALGEDRKVPMKSTTAAGVSAATFVPPTRWLVQATAALRGLD